MPECLPVMNQAINAFPQLINYENCWPVNDLMLLHLKNTSRHERLKLKKLVVAKAVKKDSKTTQSKVN